MRRGMTGGKSDIQPHEVRRIVGREIEGISEGDRGVGWCVVDEQPARRVADLDAEFRPCHPGAGVAAQRRYDVQGREFSCGDRTATLGCTLVGVNTDDAIPEQFRLRGRRCHGSRGEQA